MKISKKVVALVLSTFSLIQPTSQPLCRAMVDEANNNSANQDAFVEPPAKRIKTPYDRALQLADAAPPRVVPPSVPQLPPADLAPADLAPADLESAERLLRESGAQIFTNDALRLNFLRIVFLPKHRAYLTFLAQFLRFAVAERIPAADFSQLIVLARIFLRTFSAPCFGTTLTPELCVLAGAIAFAEESYRPFRDALAVPFTPAEGSVAVSMLHRLIDGLNSKMRLIISDVADRSLSLSAVDLVDAQLTRDALQQSELAEDFGIDLQEINDEISMAETLLRSRLMLAEAGRQ